MIKKYHTPSVKLVNSSESSLQLLLAIQIKPELLQIGDFEDLQRLDPIAKSVSVVTLKFKLTLNRNNFEEGRSVYCLYGVSPF